MARVSVVMPSYNHARFVEEAILSILTQTMDDLELVIVDDGSRDNSNDIIAAISDRRLRYVPLTRNVGACEAMNIALGYCTGDFVAVCNSDDIWESEKLERQIAVMDEMPDIAAVFSDVIWINDNGEELIGSSQPDFATIFAQPNRSRFGWIRRLIEIGNCLCHPSVLIRREVYEKVGLYDNLLRQLPDLDMWLRVVQDYDIHIMPDKLVRFRIHDENTSQQNIVNARRTWREHVLIARRFFDEVTPENFYHALGCTDIHSLPSSDPKVFVREKIGYLTKSSCAFSQLFKEIGVELAYTASRRYGENIVPALEFQELTASFTNLAPPLPPAKKRPLKSILGSVLYEKLRSANKRRRHRRAMGKALSAK